MKGVKKSAVDDDNTGGGKGVAQEFSFQRHHREGAESCCCCCVWEKVQGNVFCLKQTQLPLCHLALSDFLSFDGPCVLISIKMIFSFLYLVIIEDF